MIGRTIQHNLGYFVNKSISVTKAEQECWIRNNVVVTSSHGISNLRNRDGP